MLKLKRLIENNLIKGFLMISGGTAFIQIMNILFAPIITRIYSPDDYGILTLYTSMMAILIVFGSFYYESAIPIADTEEKAINVVALCFSILIFVVLILGMMLIAFGEPLLNLMNAEGLQRYRLLIPIGVLLTGLHNIFRKWTLRYKDFKSIFNSKLSQSITGNFVKISFGLLNFGSVGLILGNISNQSVGASVLSLSLLKSKKHLLKKIRVTEMYWCAKRYVNFFVFSLPNAIVLSFSLQMPVLFLTSVYGSEVVGLYGLANSIIKLPFALIGNSVGEVFYSEAAYIGKKNPERLISLSNKLLKKLILVGAAPLILLSFFGPQLFSIVFGQSWYEAGIYARMLSLGVFANLIFHPISRVYGVFERQKLKLFIDLFRFIAIVITFMIAGYMNLNPHYAVLIYSFLTMIFYLATYVFAQKIMKNALNE